MNDGHTCALYLYFQYFGGSLTWIIEHVGRGVNLAVRLVIAQRRHALLGDLRRAVCRLEKGT